MKLLVTGAAGFIGMNLSLRLLRRGDQVLGIDNLNNYYSPRLKQARLAEIAGLHCSGWDFQPLDIAEPDALNSLVESDPDIEAIVHLAAQAGVRYALTDPLAYARSNLLGQVAVMEFARRLPRLRKLLYASSSSVYGQNSKVPFAEGDAVDHPISLYAATKRSGELLAESYSHLFQIPTVGLRFFTVYGRWGRPDMAPWLFSKAIRDREPIKLFNHGKLARDFTYIDDIVEGILAALDRSLPDGVGNHRIYNLGNSQPIALMRFVEILEQLFGRPAILSPQPMQPGDVPTTWADLTRSQAELGYHPSTAIEDGLTQFVEWFKNYE
ncbi:MAG: NAD-dependent epimerase/dehydratase family protein [Alphaproteobacteria bacterium]|nr:NAD-dependent epimerase/dehydratase family protein [Alphaproteobacteria bacterium]